MYLKHYCKVNETSNTEETEAFCLQFDKFCDICNTRTIKEGERKRKPNLKPFYVKEDQRLKVRNYKQCNLKFYM